MGDEQGQACFVMTRRAARLKQHAGQWALPGGRLDSGETTIDAVLRETYEEVGLSLSAHQVLGILDDYPTRSGFLITPVVIWAGPGQPMTPNEEEVAAAYLVPLQVLEKPGVPTLRSIPESDRPVISIPIEKLSDSINAPTAALLYQFREVGLRGLETRVDHYDQPVFAWR
ncbi:MAG: CoA pyrophosphatase, partial [Myxococcota bacterium]